MECPLKFQTWLNKKGEPDPPTLVWVFKDNEARGINYWPTDMQTGKSHCSFIHSSLSQQKHRSNSINRLRNCHLCTKESWQTWLIWVCLLWLLLKVACSSSWTIGLNYKLIIHRETCRIRALLQQPCFALAWHVNADVIYMILFTVNSTTVDSLFLNVQSHRSTVGFIVVINIYDVQ